MNPCLYKTQTRKIRYFKNDVFKNFTFKISFNYRKLGLKYLLKLLLLLKIDLPLMGFQNCVKFFLQNIDQDNNKI